MGLKECKSSNVVSRRLRKGREGVGGDLREELNRSICNTLSHLFTVWVSKKLLMQHLS